MGQKRIVYQVLQGIGLLTDDRFGAMMKFLHGLSEVMLAEIPEETTLIFEVWESEDSNELVSLRIAIIEYRETMVAGHPPQVVPVVLKKTDAYYIAFDDSGDALVSWKTRDRLTLARELIEDLKFLR